MKLKFGIFSSVLPFIFLAIELEAMTLEQMTEGTKLMKVACMGISKATEEPLSHLRDPTPVETKEVKCYVKCMLEMMGALRKGKPDIENAVKQIEAVFPDDMKENAKNAVVTCKDAMKGIKNQCDGAFSMLMCTFKADPNFFFPH